MIEIATISNYLTTLSLKYDANYKPSSQVDFFNKVELDQHLERFI